MSWRPGRSADLSLAELAADAGDALVATDDAVRTSDSELGFAVARFGEQAAKPFTAALKAARAELAAAFRLRQQLDEDPHLAGTRLRTMLTEIIARCAEANRQLDEQSDAFDQLQNMQARAPRVLAEVDAHAAQQTARLGLSRQILDKLAAKYSPAAVAGVAASPDQAADRLVFAAGNLTDARQALAAGQAGRAAVLLQAAESAADQASDLLDGVEHLEAELTQALSALAAAIREIDTDVAEAAELDGGREMTDLPGLAAAAQAAVASVRGQQAGGEPFDSLAALRTLQRADSALDQELAKARDERDRQVRALAVLDQAMLLARSSATSAEDYVSTRRGGVGAAARTRLAEAHRHYRLAVTAGPADPESGLREAQRADALAQQARALAEEDVARFRYSEPAPVSGRSGGAGLAGAVLGGILIDSLLSGAGRGGGFGVGGGLGPGSFGGTGSRGRHNINAGSSPAAADPPLGQPLR
jgi:hypothetical protein